MNRKDEVLDICKTLDVETLKLIDPLIDRLVFLEENLNYLETLPFIIVKKDDPTRQKVTPAYKQYKDLSQSYLNALKVVNSALGIESETVESPLRKYMKQRLQEKAND